MSDKENKKEIKKDNIVLDNLKIDYMNVDDIVPNAYNPNRQSSHEFELLCRSIEEDGFTQPCVVRISDKMIVDGEHRWRAAQSIGMEEIPVVFVEMSDAQMRIATLRHNRARGEEDISLAAAVLKDLAKSGSLDDAADSLMLSDQELAKLQKDIPDPELLDSPEFNKIYDKFGGKEEYEKNRHNIVESDEEVSNALREQKDKLEELKKDEERTAVLKESDLYRLSLTYLDGEADIIREVMGKNVAENILTLCAKEYQEQGHDISDLEEEYSFEEDNI